MMKDAGKADEIKSEIKKLVLQYVPLYLRDEEITDEVSLLSDGLGLDSVDVVDLILTIEDHFGLHFSPVLLNNLPLTVEKLAEFVRDRRNS